jgi:hypothetical protein
MKKFMFLVVLVVLAASFAMAQPTATGNLNYVPTTDVQGAHENGGRGCAGCHAPHSGGRGSGGGSVLAQAFTPGGVAEGDSGLWGTDTFAIVNNSGTLNFDGTYTQSLAGTYWGAPGALGPLYTGVSTCLSCHDGNVSKGAMMSGQAYEQSFGLLNFATQVGSNGQAAAVSLYGPNPIPTLLGNDGGVAADYSNDHPVGTKATLAAVASAALSNTTGGLIVTFSGATNKVAYTTTPGSGYAAFVNAYGIPAISNLASDGSGTTAGLFVVCTTCHNQHVQNVYSAKGHGAVAIANGAVSAARTIFYVQGPYNPGAPYDPTHVPSTNAFCLQCHYSHSSQYFGATNIGTAF